MTRIGLSKLHLSSRLSHSDEHRLFSGWSANGKLDPAVYFRVARDPPHRRAG